MAHYLVTGSAGFIGSKVTAFLLADGHQVTGVDNVNHAYDVRLKEWRMAQLERKPRFQFHQIDICNRQDMGQVFSPGIDAVINLAARAGVRQSVSDPQLYFETNLNGTLTLLELCREFQVKKFVLASTSSLYGLNDSQPFREDANTDGPLSPYAASKKAAEAICYTYHYLHGIDVTVLRYFTVYGPAGRPDMSLFRFVQWIAEGRPVTINGDGQQSRDFTYVDDIARGTIAAVKPLGYEIINLGSDTPVKIAAAVQLVEKLLDKPAHIQHEPRHPADVLATWADISKAEHLLGWRPQVPFEEGVGDLVTWYLDSRSWAKDLITTE